MFFPSLISAPFHHGLVVVFAVAAGLAAVAALASLLRGGRYVHPEAEAADERAEAGGAARWREARVSRSSEKSG